MNLKGEKEPLENFRLLILPIEVAVGDDCSSSTTTCLGVDTTSKSLQGPFLPVGCGENEDSWFC